MLAYDPILENSTELEALDYARGLCWGEVESREQTIKYKNYIDTINGVGIYYDFGADYYFFTDESEVD